MASPIRRCHAVAWLSCLALASFPAEYAAADGRPQPVSLASLPEPPAELKPLLTHAKVSFLFGGTRPSLTDEGSNASSPRQDGFAAETRFRLRYQFASRCESNWVGSQVNPNLVIRVRYDIVRLRWTHEVWMKDRPTDEEFWKSTLTLHEMDHVRLSSDPTMNVKFQKAVRKHSVVRTTLPELSEALGRRIMAGERLSSAQLRVVVGSYVKQEFDRMIDLVRIRYKELDRVTGHGKRPVPFGTELAGWLGRSDQD